MTFRRFCIAAVKLHIRGAKWRLLLNLLVPTAQYDDLSIPKALSIALLADLNCLEINIKYICSELFQITLHQCGFCDLHDPYGIIYHDVLHDHHDFTRMAQHWNLHPYNFIRWLMFCLWCHGGISKRGLFANPWSAIIWRPWGNSGRFMCL